MKRIIKQSIYLSVASSLLLLASSCADEQFGLHPNAYDDSGTITISAGTQTRADEPALNPADIPYVMVSADHFLDGANSSYFYNYQFDREGSEGNYLYKSSRNPIWPAVGTLTFKAYYPSLEEMYKTNYSWNGSVPTTTIDRDIIHNFAISKGNEIPIDLMTATKDVDIDNFDTTEPVKLDLKHQLTSIEIHTFNGSKTIPLGTDPETGAVTTSWGHIIEIAGFRIKNVPVVGDFDIKEDKWLPEKTKTTSLEYIFQPGDKILKLGRLGEHSNLVNTGVSAFTFYYNQYDTKEEAAELLKYCGMKSLTMLPTTALPEVKEDGEGKEMQLQLLIRIIQDCKRDGIKVKKYKAIYPNDIGYRYYPGKGENGYFLHDDDIRYIQSDRDDCAQDEYPNKDVKGVTTIPILLKDDKIENIMEYLVEEREDGPGDVGHTFTYEDDNGNLDHITMGPESEKTCIIKNFRILESAQHYGNCDNYFDESEIKQIRETVPYNYSTDAPTFIPKGCIRRFAWIDIPLKIKDEDGKDVPIKCEAGKKYIWYLDFTNSLKNVTQVTPPDPEEEDPDEVDPIELGLFDIELDVNVSGWEEEPEEDIPAIGPYTPTTSAD